MLALRYAAVLALALWTGGLVVVGAVAAPSIFDVLGARGAEGRVLAGAVVGALLERFTVIAYGCAAVVLLSLAVRAVLGPRPRRFAYRVGGLLLMTAATVYAGAVVAPRIAALQQAKVPRRRRSPRPILDASSSVGCTALRCRCSSCPSSAVSRSFSGN